MPPCARIKRIFKSRETKVKRQCPPVKPFLLQSGRSGGKVPAVRKLISTLLIFATLFANVSWAADAHAEAHASNWPGSLAVCPSDWPQDDTGANSSDACDHCCHGFAHIVGFAVQPYLAFPAATDSSAALVTRLYRSRSQLPPIPPPNA
ncbi:MAG: hypothetical protein DSZ32_07540 [Gammaproteobacteria bacterium]|nr:MAG: hypothetical protein DSZ32_07540 [Gammaproteobacteria bacterium]